MVVLPDSIIVIQFSEGLCCSGSKRKDKQIHQHACTYVQHMRQKQSVSSSEVAKCVFSSLKYLNSVAASQPRHSWNHPLRVCRMSITVALARCVLHASVTFPRSMVAWKVRVAREWATLERSGLKGLDNTVRTRGSFSWDVGT